MKRDSRGALIAAACAIAVVLAALWFLRADPPRSLVEPRVPDAAHVAGSGVDGSKDAAAVDSAQIDPERRVGAASDTGSSATDTGPTLVLALVTAIETGLPVPHVFVTAWRDGGTVLATPQEIETDESGMAEIEVEPDVALIVSAQGDGRNTASANVEIPALARGERRNVALAIQTREDLVIHGVVLRRDTREPIAGVLVESQPVRRAGPGPRATTANDGTFRVAVRSFATKSLRYDHPDFGTALTPARAGHEEATRPLEVLLEPCAAIRAVVVDAQGADTSNWSVIAVASPWSVEQPEGSWVSAPRDLRWISFVEAGAARVEKLPARAPVDVEIRTGSRSIWHTREPLVLAPGETREIVCRTGTTSILGGVREADGAPAAGVVLCVRPSRDGESAELDASSRAGCSALATSEDDGAYRFLALEPGAWLVGPAPATPDDRDPRRDPAPILQRVVVDANVPAHHDITLVRGLVIAGRVVFTDGKPAPNAQIRGRFVAESLVSVVNADLDGAFVLGPLAPGTWSLDAVAYGASHSTPVELLAGTEDVVLRLAAEARLSVRVRDERGEALASALVTLLAADGRGEAITAQTDAHGLIRFGYIPPSTYHVAATTSDGRYGCQRDVVLRADVGADAQVDALPGGTARIRFDGPAASALVVVVDRGVLVRTIALVRGASAEVVGPLGEVEVQVHAGGKRHDKRVVLAREPGAELVFDGTWR